MENDMSTKTQEENLAELVEFMKKAFDENAFAKLDRQGFYNIFVSLGDAEAEPVVWGISKNEYEAWANALDKINNYLSWSGREKDKE